MMFFTKLTNSILITFLIAGGSISLFSQANRSIDGTLNNPLSLWGAAYTQVVNTSPLAYGDGISSPAGENRPNPRYISNAIFNQQELANDPLGLSAYVWAWGQFIDHDITLSPDNAGESLDIPVPAMDLYFDPAGTGQEVIPMFRSEYDHTTGTSKSNPRVHLNKITAFIDGSGVYGSEQSRANWLRTFSQGRLKTSQGNLLPLNTLTGEVDAEVDPDAPEMAMPFSHVSKWFVAGDVRANENPFLTSIHTIFMREHNRQCDLLILDHPDWNDEQLYQRARKIVGGLIQAIVYEEWLPALGVEAIPYQGYDITRNPGIMNAFSTAAYRYGHSTINGVLPRMDNAGNTMPGGDMLLRDAFFNPEAILHDGGIDPFLIGGASVVEQDLDCKVIDDLRNFLFGPPGSGGLDLVALNINRGRDRGLSDYNTMRTYYGLVKLSSFDQMTADPLMRQSLSEVYSDINDVDAWVGMLAEDHMENALFGPTAMEIINQQFSSLRTGDRFYYEHDSGLTAIQKSEIKNTVLSHVIRRNTGISILPDSIFQVMETVTQANRTIDGTMNNLYNTNWGATGTKVVVNSTLAYEDGFSTPSGSDRPNARFISNEIFAQEGLADDPLGLSAYAWTWGQFIDHDITLSPDNPDERLNISVPKYDAFFDPSGSGDVVIPMNRSDYDHSTGTDPSNPRIHTNGITSFIDASTVYGSDLQRAAWLRTFAEGKLKTSTGNLLPYNTLSGESYDVLDPNAPEMAMPFPFVDRFFVAGDVRANENPLLTSLHTIFVREHNRLCDQLKVENPEWTDEELYQRARKIVGALVESVVYEEWLPTLGIKLESFSGYNQTVQPGIMNVFSTAAYRYGHSTIGSTLARMDDSGNTMSEGNISLKDAFFNPVVIPEVGGIEPYLTGMATVVEQDFDCQVIDELRNFLFGAPGSGGLDLVSLNINRGRDRGLADYNTIRKDFNLPAIPSFASLTTDPVMNQRFATVYGEIEKIDPWVGMLAEDHMDQALFGRTAMTIIREQFLSLRNGDRFYYEVDPEFSSAEVDEIKGTLLSDIIRRNSGITFMQDSVFVVQSITTDVVQNSLPALDFKLYPNPATDRISLELAATDAIQQTGEIQIVDLYGKTVISKTVHQISKNGRLNIELGHSLPPGLYQVRILNNQKSCVRTFIKIDS